MTTWHLLTPEYPPACGGVGDYTALVAAALVAAGDRVHVWYPAPAGAPSSAASTTAAGVRLHQLPDRFGRESRRILTAAFSEDPGRVVLQYVPAAFGVRGLNMPFCLWIARLGRNSTDVRTMFHEPFFYFGFSRPWRNVLALVQRGMAAILLRASSRVYYSSESWIRLLAPFGTPARVEILPIPSTIPVSTPGEIAPRAARALTIGHFGTYGDHVGDELGRILPALLRRLPDARAILIGRGGGEFQRAMAADVRDRISATGDLPGSGVAAALRRCDLLVQPYPDGVTTRRTSVMAGLTAAVAVVTTLGALTERIWIDTSAVALAPAGDPAAMVDTAARLAGDSVARLALGARGREIYDREFALEITIARMRQ